MEQKIQHLIEFCQALYRNDQVKESYRKYQEEIGTVTPQEIMQVQYEQLGMGLSPEEVLSFTDKLINVVHKPLEKYVWKHPENGTFLYYLMEENKELVRRLDEFKQVIRQRNLLQQVETVRDFILQTKGYQEHLLKLENILFPYMEKRMSRYQGLKIMWLLHDRVRKQWKELIRLLDADGTEEQTLNEEIGQLYFQLYGLVQKQELILFPCATELFSAGELEEMHRQSFDYAFPFIPAPTFPSDASYDQKSRTRLEASGNAETSGKAVAPGKMDAPEEFLRTLFRTETGALDFEQLSLLLSALPIDLTYVDENDKVAYFTKPKDRIFPRSAAVIGRDVRNCHPPESVHVVETILASFRNGEKDEAEFWIQMREKFIHIRYVAMRNLEGSYRGTLEITQEISALRALEGQKRLLDW